MTVEERNTPDQDAHAARRRGVLQQVHARRHELASNLVEEYRTAISDYRELPESVLIRDVTEAAVHNIEYLVETFQTGFDVPEHDNEWIGRSAARRVHQHVSLPSLLRTYRLWGKHIWRTIADLAGQDEIGRQLAVEAADAMMGYLDSVSFNLTQAYVRESTTAAIDSQALRTDVLETLLTGDPVNERARRQKAVLAMTLRGPVLVVVVQVPQHDDPLTGLQAAIRAARNQLSPLCSTFLVGARDTEIVAICALDHGDEEPQIEAACHEIAASVRDWTVGLGRTAEGIAGVQQSYSEAREAADLGFSIHQPERAVRFADVLLDQILRATRHADALLEETVRPLVDYDRRKNADLLATLRAYVNANFNLTKAAAELTVNPNTVVYRLRRIHALTRRDPSTTDDLLLLALGLRLFDSAPPAGDLQS
ncbi:helix-turn-helix domain-containing protein [Saccharopolyspora shandongensis]|uniref:PucR family transcriptional regulator n=1 Tax=Saccharopolyspora shandongensis TaxID=418495 RepID=UPI003414BE10